MSRRGHRRKAPRIQKAMINPHGRSHCHDRPFREKSYELSRHLMIYLENFFKFQCTKSYATGKNDTIINSK